jgi:hypothetical protein
MYRETLGLCFLAMMAACADKAPTTQPPPTQQGDLGAATFTYNCGPDSDPQCNVDSELAPIAASSQFPTLAAGSTFTLTAALADGGAPLKVVPVSTSFLDKDVTGNLQTAKRAGVTTVLADQSSTLVDLTTVVIGQPDHIKVLQGTPQASFKSGSITIGTGGVTTTSTGTYTFHFRAFMVDKSDNILAGAFPCNWTSSDTTIATVTTDTKSNISSVVSQMKAGSTTVTVSLGTMTANILITVN